MTIDEFIHQKIKRRFGLAEDKPVAFEVNEVPVNDIEITLFYDVYGKMHPFTTYSSWENFNNDMERVIDDD
jgi:hypothetical protein